MGVVRKQSILSSIFTYIGFAIGAVNILILFPKYFTPEQIGLTRILLDVALLFSTVCTLGSIPITLKFYPFYKNYVPREKNDLPFITIGLCAIGCLLLLVTVPSMKPWILRKFGARSPLFVDYFDLIYPFTITLAFFSLFEAYAWSLKKTVLSNALKEFAFRLLTTVLIVLFIIGVLSFSGFIHLYAWIFLIPVLIFLYTIIKHQELPWHMQASSLTRRIRGKLFSFGGFLFAGAILNIVARTNDTIILASQSSGGLSDAAVFTIATYLVTVMEVPQRSLVSITTPFIAEAWSKRNLEKINRLYKKTSLNLMIAGLAIFGIVMLNIRDIMIFLGPAYSMLGSLVLVCGIAKLIDLSTGLNTQILLLSKYWKLDFFTNMFLVALCIPLNYWLTRKYNVMGPAYGNLVALGVFNTIRFIFIYKLFRFQPFTVSNLKALAIALAVFIGTWFIPATTNIFFNVLVKSIVFMGVYGWMILRFKVSSDITELFDIIKSRFNW
jgi:O-antigen/teichoic acid export membrane protein